MHIFTSVNRTFKTIGIGLLCSAGVMDALKPSNHWDEITNTNGHQYQKRIEIKIFLYTHFDGIHH